MFIIIVVIIIIIRVVHWNIRGKLQNPVSGNMLYTSSFHCIENSRRLR